jgi:hypothetical protein
VLFVALTLLLGGALLPANPAAALLPTPTPTPTTMTHVVIADAPPPVAGQPYGFTVVLRTTSDQQPVVNATVRLWARRPGQSTYSQVAQTHTDTSGVAQPVTTLSRNTYLYAEFPGDYSGTYGPSHTDPVLTYVSTAGTMGVDDKTLRLGQRLVVTGRTRPAKPGRRVALFLGYIPSPTSPHRPTRLARAYVRADGTYRITTRFHSTGRKRLFVRLPGGDGNVTGYTRYQRVRVG